MFFLNERKFYEEKYPILSGIVRKNKFLYFSFKILYYGLPVIMAAMYIIFVIHTFRTRGKKVLKRTVMIPALVFVAVSIFRKIFNMKRPYEKYEFTPLMGGQKKGTSMPSRHTLSAGIISATVGAFYPLLFPFLWIITGLIALMRVIAGVHHIRDVVISMLISIVIWASFRCNKEK